MKSFLWIVLAIFYIGCGGEESQKSRVADWGAKTTQAAPTLEENATTTPEDQKYKLALLEIQNRQKAQEENTSLQLSMATLESQKEQELKKSDLVQTRIEAENRVALANVGLQTTQEAERTKRLVETKNHELALHKSDQEEALAKTAQANEVMLAEKKLDFYQIALGVLAFLALLILFVYFLLKRNAAALKAKMHEEELAHQAQMKIMEYQSKNLEKMLDLVASKSLSEKVETEILDTIKQTQARTLIFEEAPKKGLIFKR